MPSIDIFRGGSISETIENVDCFQWKYKNSKVLINMAEWEPNEKGTFLLRIFGPPKDEHFGYAEVGGGNIHDISLVGIFAEANKNFKLKSFDYHQRYKVER